MSSRVLLFILLMAAVVPFAIADDSPVLVTIDGEAVTRQDLWKYATVTPAFTTALAQPGGPMRVLRNLVTERLFVLEGERLAIPRPEKGGDSLYADIVIKKVLPACPEPGEDELKAFYEENRLLFATPFYLRVERVALRYKPDNEAEVTARLEEIIKAIVAGELSFGEAVERYSEDPYSKDRQGDLGFLPEDPRNPFPPFLQALKQADPRVLTSPVKEREFISVYRATDRREPIVAAFEASREEVRGEMRGACRHDNLMRKIEELEGRWPVEYKAKEIEAWGMSMVAP